MDNYEKHFKKLGQRIMQIRKEKNITISQLSQETGICKSYLYKIENGKAPGMLLDKHLCPLARAFGVKLSYIFCFILQ